MFHKEVQEKFSKSAQDARIQEKTSIHERGSPVLKRSDLNASMSPERSSGRVRGEAPAGFGAAPHQRRKAHLRRLLPLGAPVGALLGLRPKPSGAYAPPLPRAKVSPWIRGRDFCRFARDLGETFCEQKVSPKPLSKRLYMLRVKQDNFSTKYKNSRPEPSLLFVFID